MGYQPQEALTAVAVVWDVVACSLLEVYRHLRGIYCFHLQGWRLALLVCLVDYSPEDGGRMFI